jgi:CheY-like chemotaxis protein
LNFNFSRSEWWLNLNILSGYRLKYCGGLALTKILIVEDNELNRDMLSRRLMRKGYEVEMAVDGLLGVEAMKSYMPDVVLMDIGLPVMDGWEATSLAKQTDEIKHIPIIALTAHALEEDRLKALEAGADDFDTKPVDLKRLIQKIEKWTG